MRSGRALEAMVKMQRGYLAPSHTVGKWQSQDDNPGLFNPIKCFLHCNLVYAQNGAR